MASVRQIKGRFYGRWRDEYGHRIERHLPGVATKREALREASKFEERAERVFRGLEESHAPITLAEVWTDYLKAKRGKASIRADKSRWTVHLGPKFGHCPLHTIRPADIETFLVDCEEKAGVSGNTAEKIRMLLAALYTYAIRKKRVFKGENPARAAEKPTIVQRPREELLPQYVQPVIDAVDPRWRNMFGASAYTACRAGELKPMRVQDVNVDEEPFGVIVWRSNERDVTKGKKNRWLPIPAAGLPYFRAAIRESRKIYDSLPDTHRPVPGEELLFPSDKGQQLRVDVRLAERMREALVKVGLIKHWEVSCEDCRIAPSFRRAPGVELCPRCKAPMLCEPKAIDVVFHSLRATAATTLLSITRDMRHVQQQLGHGDMKTTELYIGKNRARFAALSSGLDFSSPSFPTTSPIGPNSAQSRATEANRQREESP